jgi:hypothetical protein
MSADKEQAHGQLVVADYTVEYLAGKHPSPTRSLAELLIREREDARQQMVPHLAKLRAENMVMRGKLAELASILAIPDGFVMLDGFETPDTYLLVSSVRKVLQDE